MYPCGSRWKPGRQACGTCSCLQSVVSVSWTMPTSQRKLDAASLPLKSSTARLLVKHPMWFEIIKETIVVTFYIMVTFYQSNDHIYNMTLYFVYTVYILHRLDSLSIEHRLDSDEILSKRRLCMLVVIMTTLHFLLGLKHKMLLSQYLFVRSDNTIWFKSLGAFFFPYVAHNF